MDTTGLLYSEIFVPFIEEIYFYAFVILTLCIAIVVIPSIVKALAFNLFETCLTMTGRTKKQARKTRKIVENVTDLASTASDLNGIINKK